MGTLWRRSCTNHCGRNVNLYATSFRLAIHEKVWTLGPSLGLVVRDFGMDPSQDLLVLIERPNW